MTRITEDRVGESGEQVHMDQGERRDGGRRNDESHGADGIFREQALYCSLGRVHGSNKS